MPSGRFALKLFVKARHATPKLLMRPCLGLCNSFGSFAKFAAIAELLRVAHRVGVLLALPRKSKECLASRHYPTSLALYQVEVSRGWKPLRSAGPPSLVSETAHKAAPALLRKSKW